MKSRVLTCTIAMAVIAVAALPAQLVAQDNPANPGQTRYSVINVGTLGGSVGAAYGINNKGWVIGDADLPGDQTEHGFLWRKGVKTDLGTFGGPTSGSGGTQ